MINVCFYHDDLDGCCAGALIKNIHDPNTICYPVNYNKKFPIDKVLEWEHDPTVWIVDYSPTLEEMDELVKAVGAENIIRIDHHVKAIEAYKDYPVKLKGILRSGDAGCTLTAEYLGNMGYIMDTYDLKCVSFVDRYDTWKWSKESPEAQQLTTKFISGINGVPHEPGDAIWTQFFDGYTTVTGVAEAGATIDEYNVVNNASMIRNYAFKARIDGVDCVVCNFRFNSTLFGQLRFEYPVTSTFTFDGEKYNISLFSEESENQVDVNSIAKKLSAKYGTNGGGHKGAAGFSAPELPYTDIVPLWKDNG